MTSLRRQVTYQYANPLLKLANVLVLKRKVARELGEGLEKFKQIVEKRQAPR